ncbi:hypothetical protein DB347_16040 [Opitutaceae bacterium EW11]|nr:hypothetical protein DB347_16040 [Opitutaceae bacterium EW11]
MKHLRFIVFALCAWAGLHAQIGPGNTPVRRFRLPSFNQEGFRTALLEGEEADAVSPTEIHLKEMRFSLFAGDETNALDSTLLAPRATVRIPEQNHYLVEGPGPVRLIRNDLDVSGENWLYDHNARKLWIRKDAQVIFRSELKDLLK